MVMAMHGSILSEIQVNNVVVAVVISIWYFLNVTQPRTLLRFHVWVVNDAGLDLGGWIWEAVDVNQETAKYFCVLSFSY